MRIGMVGPGRMGSNMARRLMLGGHQCVAFDLNADSLRHLGDQGAATEQTVLTLADHFESGDTLIDGGNSYYLERPAGG